MIILNFGHPITDEQKTQIERLAGIAITSTRTLSVQIHQEQPLTAQICELVETIELTSQEWQALPLLINPPGYAPAALVLLAELHGRMGHFPTLIRLRSKAGPVTSYEVAELLNLQDVREQARTRR